VFSETANAWVRSGPEFGAELSDDAAGNRRWVTAREAEAEAQAEAERQRGEVMDQAARMAQQLRELGIDPDRL